jgi:hypothetical protein
LSVHVRLRSDPVPCMRKNFVVVRTRSSPFTVSVLNSNTTAHVDIELQSVSFIALRSSSRRRSVCDPHSVITAVCLRRSASLPVRSGLGQFSSQRSGQGEDASLPIMLHGGTVEHSPAVNLLVDPVEL